MSVIQQLPFPHEIQEMIRGFYYYSKTEHVQRTIKKKLMRQLDHCERLYWKDIGTFYDYFYYKTENWKFCSYENNIYYITQEINILSAIFCKECHNYISSNTLIPACIECGCLQDINFLDVD